MADDAAACVMMSGHHGVCSVGVGVGAFPICMEGAGRVGGAAWRALGEWGLHAGGAWWRGGGGCTLGRM